MKARLPIKLSSKQSKAMDDEIRKQCAVIEQKYERDIELMILYTMHITLGFGKVRLKRFYDSYRKLFKEMSDKYEFEPDEVMWLIDRNFKESGIDAKSWVDGTYKQ